MKKYYEKILLLLTASVLPTLSFSLPLSLRAVDPPVAPAAPPLERPAPKTIGLRNTIDGLFAEEGRNFHVQLQDKQQPFAEQAVVLLFQKEFLDVERSFKVLDQALAELSPGGGPLTPAERAHLGQEMRRFIRNAYRQAAIGMQQALEAGQTTFASLPRLMNGLWEHLFTLLAGPEHAGAAGLQPWMRENFEPLSQGRGAFVPRAPYQRAFLQAWAEACKTLPLYPSLQRAKWSSLGALLKATVHQQPALWSRLVRYAIAHRLPQHHPMARIGEQLEHLALLPSWNSHLRFHHDRLLEADPEAWTAIAQGEGMNIALQKREQVSSARVAELLAEQGRFVQETMQPVEQSFGLLLREFPPALNENLTQVQQQLQHLEARPGEVSVQARETYLMLLQQAKTLADVRRGVRLLDAALGELFAGQVQLTAAEQTYLQQELGTQLVAEFASLADRPHTFAQRLSSLQALPQRCFAHLFRLLTQQGGNQAIRPQIRAALLQHFQPFAAPDGAFIEQLAEGRGGRFSPALRHAAATQSSSFQLSEAGRQRLLRMATEAHEAGEVPVALVCLQLLLSAALDQVTLPVGRAEETGAALEPLLLAHFGALQAAVRRGEVAGPVLEELLLPKEETRELGDVGARERGQVQLAEDAQREGEKGRKRTWEESNEAEGQRERAGEAPSSVLPTSELPREARGGRG